MGAESGGMEGSEGFWGGLDRWRGDYGCGVPGAGDEGGRAGRPGRGGPVVQRGRRAGGPRAPAPRRRLRHRAD